MGKVDKESLLTQTRLKEVLDYNPTTGEFVRTKGGRGRQVNKVTGCQTSAGYIVIGVDNEVYYAHRLAWLYVHGYFPKGEKSQLDHIDGDKSNNRLVNLKECNGSENMRNKKMYSNNPSGVNGVNFREIVQLSGKIDQYWVALWKNAQNKLHRKYFSIEKHGNEQAKELATLHRKEKIRELCAQDINYSIRHGI